MNVNHHSGQPGMSTPPVVARSRTPRPSQQRQLGASGPRRAWPLSAAAEALIVCLLCLAALCLFYFEVIFEQRTFLPFGSPGEVMGGAPPWQFSGTIRPNPYRLDAGGSAWQLEPWARTVANSYATGQLPLWNPYQFFGTPLAADGQPGAFDILRMPALVTSHAWGWDLYYLSQSAMSLGLTYVFGRSVGFRPVAASVTALAYTFSGFMFIRGNMHYIEVFHLVPAILWGTERTIRGAYRSGMLIVAIAVALTLLAGMPEAALLTFLYGASFGAFRAAWEGTARRSWRFGLQRLLVVGGAWLAGIGLTAPMLVPMVEYLGQSYNIHPPERGLGLVSLPLRALSYIGVPFINGLPTHSITSFGLTPLDDYSGAAVVLLASVGGLSARQLGRAAPAAWFALVSAIVWGGKLFGVPGFQALGQLPLLVQTLIFIWGTPLLSFSLAVLAGAGVQAVAMRHVTWRGSLVAGLVFAFYLAVAVRLNWETLQSAGARHAAATLGLAAAAGLAAWLCVFVGRRRRPALAASLACVVVAAELLALAPHDVYSDRYDSLAEPPYVAWLAQQQAAGQPFRVFSNDGLLFPDYAQAFGLDDPRVIDGLYPRRTWDFVHTFLSPSTSDRYVGGFGHPELPTPLFDNRWLDFSNVRFILRPADQSPSDATLAQGIVAANYPPTDEHHVSLVTLDGQRKEVLVERTPGEVAFRLRPEAAQPTLTFLLGLDPNMAAGGAEFTVSIQSDGQRQQVFQRSLDTGRASDRTWVPGRVDLSPYLDQDVELILQTRSLDGSLAAPVWGDLRLSPVPDAGQFRSVYAGEISIWENTHAAPRAFLVDNVQQVASPGEAIAQMQTPGFDPLTSAVVEAAGGSASLPTGSVPSPSTGTVSITDYTQQQVKLQVEADHLSLLVLTESYYPGWTATLDGATTPILPADLAFRGVLIPPGSHQVGLSYAPASFSVGLAIAVTALVLLSLAMLGLSRRPAVPAHSEQMPAEAYGTINPSRE